MSATPTPPLAREFRRTMSAATFTPPVKLRHIEWESIDKKKFYTIGPALFLGVRAVTYPPALIKTRLQVQQFRTTPVGSATVNRASASDPSSKSATNTNIRRGQYKNTMEAFRTIIKTDGPLALWQGFLPKTIGLIGGNVYISCYELFRSRMRNQYACSQVYSDAVAGAAASLISQVIIVPIDLLSQRMAVDLDGGTLGAHFRAVWKEAGFYGLYRGYFPSILTYAPASSIWWSTYGVTKPIAADPIRKIVVENGGSMWMTERCTESLCGAIAGATAGLLTNPMDVVKVRRQLAGNDISTSSIVRELYRSEGIVGFSRGATARVLNMSPSGALVVTVYECIKRLSQKVDDD
jgi:solute carrier family 25, member 44|tara:strand:+ start:147 stop:1199 length:1053 start_codon:yes stop_codon:yes gene_type:complete